MIARRKGMEDGDREKAPQRYRIVNAWAGRWGAYWPRLWFRLLHLHLVMMVQGMMVEVMVVLRSLVLHCMVLVYIVHRFVVLGDSVRVRRRHRVLVGRA